MGPLLAFFPHPDDETFTAAGVMAAAIERGVAVTLVSATRGEEGESSIPGLNEPERLGEVREEELREAMRRLGVTDVRVLGYRDSGMAGSAAAEHPQAFVRAPVAAVSAQFVPIIRSIRPQTIVTFGPEGLYGHPDHLHTHEVAMNAVHAAADHGHRDGSGREPWQAPYLYFGAISREDFLEMAERPNNPLQSLPPEARENLGVPRAEITHFIDISPWADQKRAAIAAHRTQTGEGGPLSGVPEESIARQLSRESFVRAHMPWNDGAEAPDIIATLASERPQG